MMNLPFISPKTIARIARGAVWLKQSYHYHSHEEWESIRYRIRVAYPNGYGASIIVMSMSIDDSDAWEVTLLKDDELWHDDEGNDSVWSDLTEEEVIQICDRIYFY